MSAKYIYLAKSLREQIIQNTGYGIYKLPSENGLCRQYGVSRQTVRQALHLLEEEGLIEKRQGSGSFATGRSVGTNVIAVVVAEEEEYIYPSLIFDIKSALRPRGYSIQVYSHHGQIALERKILEQLLYSPIRGLLMDGCKTALPNPNLDLYERLKEQSVSILFLHGSYPSYSGSICIRSDDYYGGYLLGRHFLQKNHKKIAAIFKLDDAQGLERYRGLSTALRDFSIEFPDEKILWYTQTELAALERKSDTTFLASFLHKQLKNCSAVICHNDEIAYWLIKELQYADLQVPADISVASFDNSYLSEICPVRLTTLSHKSHEMGTTAVQCLLQMIQGIPVSSQELPWRLVSRESDAPFPF